MCHLSALIVVLLGIQADAETTGTTSEPPRFVYSLSKSSIVSGEPISLTIRMEKTASGHKYDAGFFLGPYNTMDITLLDQSMKPFGARRQLVVRPSSQMIAWLPTNSDHFPDGFEIPVHLRISTVLPDGNYYVKLTSLEVCVTNTVTRNQTHLNLTSPPLPLEVHKGSPDELRQIYKGLLNCGLEEDRRLYQKGWLGDDWRDYSTSTRLIMWAYGPSAVSTQIDALYDEKTFRFRYWSHLTVHAYQNISEFGTPEDIKRLAAIADSQQFLEGERSDGHDENLLWLFQELKKKGDPKILPLIEPTLFRFPKEINLHQLENPLG